MSEAVGSGTILHRLGAKPCINAMGVYTGLGGSIISPTVWQAMTESNKTYVEMAPLMDSAGQMVADMLGAEAGRVTPGASSAIALMVAACMTGTEGEKMERLPDTRGRPDEVLLQKRQRYLFVRMIRHPGARIIESVTIRAPLLLSCATPSLPDRLCLLPAPS
jgi:L-seryl-tRNA(Ser) seleniumtransferase